MTSEGTQQSLTLPFRQGTIVIELGGGDIPIVRPNYDIRPGPFVDQVMDFNKPLPLPSGCCDGIICKFAIEHISWKTVRGFIAETHRLLKPGGIAVFITANLLSQARKLVETEMWNDDLVCAIFGGQGYKEDTHTTGWSPEYAVRMFKEQGYFDVKVEPLPWCDTDMTITAYKSSADVTYSLPTKEV